MVDLSLSKQARGKVKLAADEGRPIPEGWALDADGNPTTDAAAAMGGSMLPLGDAKGAALVLAVEIMAAAMTGAHFGYEASSFFDDKGGPPRVGQFILGFNPGPLSGGSYAERLEVLLCAVTDQPGTRLPGARRFGAERVERTGDRRTRRSHRVDGECCRVAAGSPDPPSPQWQRYPPGVDEPKWALVDANGVLAATRQSGLAE